MSASVRTTLLKAIVLIAGSLVPAASAQSEAEGFVQANESMFNRYNIVSERDVAEVKNRMETVVMSGALRSACAWRCDNQLPTRMPVDFTLLTRLIPCASSGASNPLSAASPASLRIADILIMMDDDPRRRSSSDTRQALTVALVKPGRGACWNQP